MRPRIFVTQPVGESALTRLRRVADVTMNPDSSRILPKSKLCAALRKHDLLFALLHDTVDRDVLAANPKLRAVASMCTTPDRIDVAEATRRRIPVTVIAPVVHEATADIAFALILAVARRIVEGDELVRAGGFPGSQSLHLAGAAVCGSTLGLVGAGRVGQAVARRAAGFSMRTLYYDPRRKSESEEREAGPHLHAVRSIAAPIRFRLRAFAARQGYPPSDRRPRAGTDEEDGDPHQHRARTARRRGRPDPRAQGRPDRRRRARRLRA